jgi:sporulation protein YlmC with PRC-barrel domain
MIKNLMTGAAIGALMVSSALAQSPNAPSTPPAVSQTAPIGTVQFIAAQKADQWLASKFKGTDVLGADNQKVGDISDILFDKSGKIEAYVVSVGGVLGVGAKEVAMTPSSFQLVPGDSAGPQKLKTSMTKDQLTNAQAFVHYEAKPATTGAGSSGGLGGARPSSNTAPTGR